MGNDKATNGHLTATFRVAALRGSTLYKEDKKRFATFLNCRKLVCQIKGQTDNSPGRSCDFCRKIFLRKAYFYKKKYYMLFFISMDFISMAKIEFEKNKHWLSMAEIELKNK